MELNATFFSNVSSYSETDSTESDTDTRLHQFLIYVNLFGLPLGVLLVIFPALTCHYHHIEEQKTEAEE